MSLRPLSPDGHIDSKKKRTSRPGSGASSVDCGETIVLSTAIATSEVIRMNCQGFKRDWTAGVRRGASQTNQAEQAVGLPRETDRGMRGSGSILRKTKVQTRPGKTCWRVKLTNVLCTGRRDCLLAESRMVSSGGGYARRNGFAGGGKYYGMEGGQQQQQLNEFASSVLGKARSV